MTPRDFAVKCASYLNRGVAVVIVDVVTERAANMHAEILDVLRLHGVAAWQPPDRLYAVAYRMTLASGRHQIEAWPEAMHVGAALPMMPLWIDVDLSVRLDLETSYVAACESLRMPPA